MICGFLLSWWHDIFVLTDLASWRRPPTLARRVVSNNANGFSKFNARDTRLRNHKSRFRGHEHTYTRTEEDLWTACQGCCTPLDIKNEKLSVHTIFSLILSTERFLNDGFFIIFLKDEFKVSLKVAESLKPV